MFRSHGIICKLVSIGRIISWEPSADTPLIMSVIAAAAAAALETTSSSLCLPTTAPFTFTFPTTANTLCFWWWRRGIRGKSVCANCFHVCAVTLCGDIVLLGLGVEGNYLS